mmetsp:Transcript_4911/g.7097  ORF Transcript_4911/g.7097 Transcript_4911/m.7097 type:complete len:361 (+) Transcript_4911:130-1212(+)|eukprot:CAMPEP_0194210312 /NCGR_PEP_ID=MMETSP0156-20130528/8147_1 /TAXON_ID=33649 /ORGANISM="Thalassionema nitzschioides, Strain L26-B" /LENGTH=360 /DNA_ID=CAMNT_0038937639 /DNA_START=104 /DNA_END=1186 /DNA_ORIENTATION=-
MFCRVSKLCFQESNRRLMTSTSKQTFRPRRRPNRAYRPLNPHGISKVKKRNILSDLTAGRGFAQIDDFPHPPDGLDDYDADLADSIRERRLLNRAGGDISIEEQLSMADYLTASPGSLEEMKGERRLLALDGMDEEARKSFKTNLDGMIEKLQLETIDLGQYEYPEEENDRVKIDGEEEEVDRKGQPLDPLQLAYGQWGESIIRVDRVQKVQKGGTMVRYRALVVGGNTRGCAGFGIAKANSPQEATQAASRQCKRNIFFIDRHAGAGLTRDLAGRHNSCKVTLLAVSPFHGLHGHPLVSDILLYFGIADCTAKTHGNRNQYNVVRATFKAIMTHESLEDIARKRGRRLLNLERAQKLQI